MNNFINPIKSISKSKNFLKNSDFRIDWDYALKIATDKFYKEKTLESAQYLTEVQRLYKKDDIDGYLNLLNGEI